MYPVLFRFWRKAREDFKDRLSLEALDAFILEVFIATIQDKLEKFCTRQLTIKLYYCEDFKKNYFKEMSLSVDCNKLQKILEGELFLK